MATYNLTFSKIGNGSVVEYDYDTGTETPVPWDTPYPVDSTKHTEFRIDPVPPSTLLYILSDYFPTGRQDYNPLIIIEPGVLTQDYTFTACFSGDDNLRFSRNGFGKVMCFYGETSVEVPYDVDFPTFIGTEYLFNFEADSGYEFLYAQSEIFTDGRTYIPTFTYNPTGTYSVMPLYINVHFTGGMTANVTVESPNDPYGFFEAMIMSLPTGGSFNYSISGTVTSSEPLTLTLPTGLDVQVIISNHGSSLATISSIMCSNTSATISGSMVTIPHTYGDSVTININYQQYKAWLQDDGNCNVTYNGVGIGTGSMSSGQEKDQAVGYSIELNASDTAYATFSRWEYSLWGMTYTDWSRTLTLNGMDGEIYEIYVISTPKTATVTVVASPNAGGTVSGGGNLPAGSTTIIRALANPGYKFSHWLEDGVIKDWPASQSFIVYASHTYTAVFIQEVAITTAISPSTIDTYVTVSPTGTRYEGDELTLTALTRDSSYQFSSWSYTMGDTSYTSTDNPLTINSLVGPSANFIANFEQIPSPYRVHAFKSPADCPCTVEIKTKSPFYYGDTVRVLASDYRDSTAYAEWSFVCWRNYDGQIVSTQRDYSFTITKDEILTAYFEERRINVNLTPSPSQGGTVSGGGQYSYNASVTVTATPNSNYVFGNWTKNGTVVSTNASYTFNATEDVSLTANFKRRSHVTLVTSPTAGGNAYASYNGQYYLTDFYAIEGDVFSVSAYPNSNYSFRRWLINGSPVTPPQQYNYNITTHNADMVVTAEFTSKITLNISASEGGTVSPTTITDYLWTTHTLTATPNEGYRFEGWYYNDVLLSDRTPYNLELTSQFVDGTTVEGRFTLKHVIQLDSIPADICTLSGAGTYDDGELATISYEFKDEYKVGYIFDGWFVGSDLISTSKTYAFEVRSSMNITAHFSLKNYQIAFQTSPTAGGTIIGGTTGEYPINTVLTLTPVPNEGYKFKGWSEEIEQDSEGNYKLVVDDDKIITAFFGAIYPVIIAVDPEGAGTVDVSGGTYHTVGEKITLTANANTGYTFLFWSLRDTLYSTNQSIEITFNGDTSDWAAHFRSNVVLTTNVNPANSGYITGNKGTYYRGETFSVTANEYTGYSSEGSTGYKFIGWYDSDNTLLTTNNTYSNSIYESMTLTAKYTYTEYDMSVLIYPDGAGNVNINGTVITSSGVKKVKHNDLVTINATPTSSNAFLRWIIDHSYVEGNPKEFLATKNRSITAIFSTACTVTLNQTTGGSATGGGTYASGSDVTLTATPNVNYIFSGWYETSGTRTLISTDNPYIITDIQSSYIIEPLFTETYYNVTAQSYPEGLCTFTGEGTYGANALATLTYDLIESSESKYDFLGWYLNGNKVSENNPYTFNVLNNCLFTARFIRVYDISVNYDSTHGYVTGEGEYQENELVTLTAIVTSEHYEFTGWYENDVLISQNNILLFRATSDRVLEARFRPYVLVTVIMEPELSEGYPGIIDGAGYYKIGSSVRLLATEYPGSLFLGWYDTNHQLITTDNPYTFTVTEDVELIASFETGVTYNVEVIGQPAGRGTVLGGGDYLRRVITQILAEPVSSLYSFTGWYDEDDFLLTTDNIYTFMLLEDSTFTAKFANNYTVALTVEGDTSEIPGLVYGAGTYIDGSSVTITAVENLGYEFMGWYEQGSLVPWSTEASHTFNINSNLNLIAKFEARTYTISASVSPSSGGTISGVKDSYRRNELSLLTFTPAIDYRFISWEEINGSETRVVSNELTYSFNVAKNTTLVANARFITYYNCAVTSEGVGTITGGGRYEENTEVTLTATPNEGYLVKWYKYIDDAWVEQSSERKIKFTITEDVSYKAVFTAIPITYYHVKTRVNDPTMGSAVSYDTDVVAGTELVFWAIENESSEHYKFCKWFNTNEDKRLTSSTVSYDRNFKYVVNSDIDFTVWFAAETNYTVTIESNPEDKWKFSPKSPITKSVGSSVNISGYPDDLHYRLRNVTINDTFLSTNNVVTFDLFEDTDCVYNLYNVATINVRSSDERLGKVYPKKWENIEVGTSVTVEAVCNEDFIKFLYWRNSAGTQISTEAKYTFTVVGDDTLTAVFDDGEISPLLMSRDANWKKQQINDKRVDICGQFFMAPGSNSLDIYAEPIINKYYQSKKVGILRAPTTANVGEFCFYNVYQIDRPPLKLIVNDNEDGITNCMINYCSPGYQIDQETGEKYIWLCIYYSYNEQDREYKYGWIRYIDNKLTDSSSNYYIYLNSVKLDVSNETYQHDGASGARFLQYGNVLNDSGPVNWNKIISVLPKKYKLVSNTPCILCREEKRWFTTRGYERQGQQHSPLYISNKDSDGLLYDCLSDTGISLSVTDGAKEQEDLIKPRFEATLAAGEYDIYDYCTGLQVVNGKYQPGIWLSLRYNYSNKHDSEMFRHSETFIPSTPSGTWLDERSSEIYNVGNWGDYNHTDIDVSYTINGDKAYYKYGQSPNALYDFTKITSDLAYVNLEGDVDYVTAVENRRKSHCNNQNLVLIFINTATTSLTQIANNILNGSRDSSVNNHLLQIDNKSKFSVYNTWENTLIESLEKNFEVNSSNGLKLLLSPVYDRMSHKVYSENYTKCEDSALIHIDHDEETCIKFVDKTTIDDNFFEKKWRKPGFTSMYSNYILNECDNQYTKYNKFGNTSFATRVWATIGTAINKCQNVAFLETTLEGKVDEGLVKFYYDNLIDFDNRKGQNYEPVVWRQFYIRDKSDEANMKEVWNQSVLSNGITNYNDICPNTYKSYYMMKGTNISTNVNSIKATTLFTELYRTNSVSSVEMTNRLFRDLFVKIDDCYYDHFTGRSYTKPLAWVDSLEQTSSLRSYDFIVNRGANYELLDNNSLNIVNSYVYPNFYLSIDYDNTRATNAGIKINYTPYNALCKLKVIYRMYLQDGVSYVDNAFAYNQDDLGTMFNDGEVLIVDASTYNDNYSFTNWQIAKKPMSTNWLYTHTVDSETFGSNYTLLALFEYRYYHPTINVIGGTEIIDERIDTSTSTTEDIETGKKIIGVTDTDGAYHSDETTQEQQGKITEEKEHYTTWGPYKDAYKLVVKLTVLETSEQVQIVVYGNSYTNDNWVYRVDAIDVYKPKEVIYLKTYSWVAGAVSGKDFEYLTNDLLFTMLVTRDENEQIIDGSFYDSGCKYKYILSYSDLNGEWHNDTEFWSGDFTYSPTVSEDRIIQRLELKDKLSGIMYEYFKHHNYINCKLIVRAIRLEDVTDATYTEFEYPFTAKIKTSYDHSGYTNNVFRPDVRPYNYELRNEGLVVEEDSLYKPIQGVEIALAGFAKIYGGYDVDLIVDGGTEVITSEGTTEIINNYENLMPVTDISVEYTPACLSSKSFKTSWERLDTDKYAHRWHGQLGGGDLPTDAITIPKCSSATMGSEYAMFYANVTAHDDAYEYDTTTKQDQYSTHSFAFPYDYNYKTHGLKVYAYDYPNVTDFISYRTASSGTCLNDVSLNKNIKATFKLTYSSIRGYNSLTNIVVECNGTDWSHRLTQDSEGVYSIIIGNNDLDPFKTYSVVIKLRDDVLTKFSKSPSSYIFSSDCLMPMSLRQDSNNLIGVSFGSVAQDYLETSEENEAERVKFSIDVNFITDASITVSKVERNSKGKDIVVSDTSNAFDFISRSGDRLVVTDASQKDIKNNLYIDNIRITNNRLYSNEVDSNKRASAHSLFISTDVPEEFV